MPLSSARIRSTRTDSAGVRADSARIRTPRLRAARLRPALARALAASLVLLVALPAVARIQGAKGRRLQVFHSLEPYRGGAVVIEEPEVVPDSPKRVVRNQDLAAFARQFLETRLRELPWDVRAWHDEFGPVTRESPAELVLVLDPTLFVQGRQLVLECFLRDLASGRVLARYQGYGRSSVRGPRHGARDDLQELSRVLVAYLAEELKVGTPRWNGYEPEPYRRRDRDELRYRMLGVDKDRDLPRALHHRDPPLNDEVRERREPVEVELRDRRPVPP